MKSNLIPRLLEYSTRVLKITEKIGSTIETKTIRHQLSKSATSVGANYMESQSASSRADFINKLQISLKELMETIYWLNLIQNTYAEKFKLKSDLDFLIQESEELRKILSSSILTARQNGEESQNAERRRKK